MGKICGAPGCGKLTARAAGQVGRRISNIGLCHGCYQRIWELSKATGKSKERLLKEGVPPPRRPLPRIATKCAREGCSVKLPKNAGPGVRRTIGRIHVCNLCYQTAWYYSKKDNVSIEEAYHGLKPKNWRPDPPKTIRCAIPWCDVSFVPDEESLVGKGVYACGGCRGRFKFLGQRPRYKGRDWKDLAKSAIKGVVARPGTPELCAMSWCQNCEAVRHRGPNGEPVCNTDRTYLYNYAKRHSLSFAEAFRTAPPPRLLHTRGRAS